MVPPSLVNLAYVIMTTKLLLTKSRGPPYLKTKWFWALIPLYNYLSYTTKPSKDSPFPVVEHSSTQRPLNPELSVKENI